jgi:hypothetical protein
LRFFKKCSKKNCSLKNGFGRISLFRVRPGLENREEETHHEEV